MTQEELNDKLLDAVYKNDIAGVKEVLSLGAYVNSADAENWTSLMNAAWYGYTDVARLLIEHNADINAADKYGQTALIHTCEYGYTDIAKLLLDSGADINHKNNNGYTALMRASWRGYYDSVKLLLKYNADIDIKNNDCETALLSACACPRNNNRIIEALFEAGADPNIINDNKWTAVMFLASHGHIEPMETVVRYGADLDIRNNGNRTALDILRERHPDKYEKWMKKTAGIRLRQEKLKQEDSVGGQRQVPDYNI